MLSKQYARLFKLVGFYLNILNAIIDIAYKWIGTSLIENFARHVWKDMYEISRKHNVFIAHKEILSYYKYFVFTYFWTCKTTRRTINKTYYIT